MTLTDAVTTANRALNNLVWGLPMCIVILAVGLYLTAGSGGVQFRHFLYAMKHTLGKMFGGQPSAGQGAITPFQAVSTALAATVGTGNIAGVAGAIAMGGPGAVFWMWVAALVGMCTKFSEVVLAVSFRERNRQGEWAGGAMYYIKNGLGENYRWLAALFGVFTCLASFGIGNLAQVNSITTTVADLVRAFSSHPEALDIRSLRIIVGLALALVAAFVLFGGIKRIGAATSRLVPFMAVFYILGTLTVIIINAGRLGAVLEQIFANAFGLNSVIGGTAGYALSRALTWGCKRGIFSNEAGLGSASIAHAAADTKGPVYQGLYGIFEVFLDTIIICTLTALVILTSGAEISYGVTAGASLTTSALATVFGAKFSALFMAIALGCFAFSTLLGWSLYGTRCAEFLFGAKAVRPYQVVFICIVFIGAIVELGLAWDISDTMNGLMAIPNLIALLALAGTVFKLTRDHFDQVRKGKIE